MVGGVIMRFCVGIVFEVNFEQFASGSANFEVVCELFACVWLQPLCVFG